MTGATVLAGVVVIYAIFAGRLDRLSITAPMVFVLTGAVLGPEGTGTLPLSLSSETTLTITELTLALLLFADASTLHLDELKRDGTIPLRLLLIGLPLTMLLGTVLAAVIEPGIGWAAAALIATILAPTDAALGLAVVTDVRVPGRVRRALNVESGLNDGLATPFVTLFLAVLLSEESSSTEGWGVEAVTELGVALAVAVVVGLAGGWLVGAATKRGWTSPLSEQLVVLAMAVGAYTGAVALGGNGFVSAFVAGLLFGQATRRRLVHAVGFTENAALFSSFFVWTVFGALFVGKIFSSPVAWSGVCYAALSLTVVRMVPVGISLAGLELQKKTLLFMGWFGPRGLASVVFLLVALEEIEAGSGHPGALAGVVTWTILLSVLAHGFSAGTLSARYGDFMGRPTDAPELGGEHEPRTRQRALVARSREPAPGHTRTPPRSSG